MIKGKQAVLDYFDTVNNTNDNQYVHFRIYKKGGDLEKGNACISTPAGRDHWTVQHARDLLNKWLEMQEYGQFTIMLNDTEKASARGNIRQDFNIDQGSHVAAVSGPPPPSAADIDNMVMTKVTEILDKKAKEKELADAKAKVIQLEKDLKEKTRQADDPWNKFIGSITPYVPDLLVEAGFLKHKVAGVPQSEARPVNTATADDIEHEEVSGTDFENQKRLEIALKKIAAVRPADWLELLEMIANAVEKNPSLADKVKMFL